MPTSILPSLILGWREVVFVIVYVLLDWLSFVHPLYGLNITPWNPAPALGLIYWLHQGKRAVLPWFISLLIGEALVRGWPVDLPLTFILSLFLTLGYGLIGEMLKRRFVEGRAPDNRPQLFTWLVIVALGTLGNAIVYVTQLAFSGSMPQGAWAEAVVRFWIGDCVGIVVTMPILWLMAEPRGRGVLKRLFLSWETLGYILLGVAMLWATFGFGMGAGFQQFYFLFLPIVWAAARQGLAGAALVASALQLGVIVVVQWLNVVTVEVYELQMLGAVLALVGFFIGVVVDEQRQAVEDLKHTLRLAAAGEMASALAHELNQPMTALTAYGEVCEHLISRGETGNALKDAIRRMVAESARAADVVRRLRDFFRTGATRLESIEVAALLSAATAPFSLKAREQGVELRVEPAPDGMVFIDRLQVEVVLRNLLSNAFEAVAARAPGARSVTLSTTADSGNIRMTVEDSGPGIAPSAAGHVFEPFVSTKSSGLGLGLVISRAIIEAHGGNLWAETGGRGVFRFTLPLQEKRQDAAT
ncbi:MAG TPA: ATP-binding protein [Burkholderiales bacterium]